MSNNLVVDLVSGLKARHTETRHKAIRELLHFAKTDLREMSQDTMTQVLDDFNQQINTMTSSYDNNEKKAGILIIVCLIGSDVETTKSRTMRYAHYLRYIFPTTDISVLELAAKTMGRLAATLGVKRGEYVEFEIKRAYEWLQEERNEGKRLSAVLILRELAIAMPSHFYQHISNFFKHIKVALRDPKDQIREAAAKALRAALVITTQRELPENSNKVQWYAECYEEAATSFNDQMARDRGLSRDEHVHGALLILNELLRCSNSAWEKKYTMLMQKLDTEQETSDDMFSINAKFQNSWSSIPDEKNETTIYESNMCKILIADKYEKICADVMAQQISRSHHVHQLLLLLIPRLAAFNRESFSRRHLKSTINHLITFLRGKEKEKVMAFTTLGLICVAVESDVKQYLSRIIDIIKSTLPIKDTPKKRIGSDTPLFNCVTLLGVAMKEGVVNDVRELLDPMCATGLSPQLTTCFKELAQNMPSLRKEITDRLINMLSLILRKKPYVPNNSEHQKVQMMSTALLEPHDATKLVLALRTLGSFDFEWTNTLMSFIRRCTDHYLLSEQHDIRLEAVKTAAKLLVKAVERCSQTNSRTLNLIIDESLGKLLSVGRSDFDQEVRYKVLEVFANPVFDKYLAVEEHLSCLFVAINDSNSDVSELALCVVGRLSNINPSYTTPTMRQLFVHVLMELQYSESTRNKEQSLRMINNIICHAPRITQQFVDIILKVLVPKLREVDSNTTMVSTILKAIGDLAEVNGGGHALNQWLPELLSFQVETLSDPNQLEKRSIALWSFGQVIAATGHVVMPYMEYSHLMDLLLSFLKTEQQIRDRRETVRVLGLLGALDPYKHKVNKGLIDFQTVSTLIPITETTKNDYYEANVSDMLVKMAPLILDEFYPAIVVTCLMTILRDPQLAQHHTSVVHSVTIIFQSLGIKCVPYISRVTPSLLFVIRNTDNSNFREFLLTQLAQLISVVKIHIRNYLEDIFDMIREYWTPDSHLQPTLIMLVEHITVAIGTEFKIYLRKILPNILRVLKHDKSKDRVLTERLLLTIQKFENNLDDVLLSVVPAITGLFDGKNIPMSISKLAMETMNHLSMFLYLKPYSAVIIQALAKVLENNPALRPTAMNTLCALIVQLGREYIDYIPSVERLMLKHKIQCPNYVVLVTRLQVISTLASDDDYLDETRSRLRNQKSDVLSNTSDMQSIQKLTVNVNNLRKCWSTQNIISKEDWTEWLRHLSIGFLTESNSPALRACSSLAQHYPQLARELFSLAFMSCWTELAAAARRELAAALERALTAGAPDLALAVLNLAEFCEHCEKGHLPIPVRLLGDTAIGCRAYAKALYYKEEEYRRNPTTQVVEALIHINNKLQQKEAANGLLEQVIAQQKKGDCSYNVNVRWYEKLNNWEQALDLYNKKLEVEPQDGDAKLGLMRCLEAMGEWRKLYDITTDQWTYMNEDIKKKSAKLAAAASWGLQEWDSMKKFTDVIPEDSQEGAFYRAIIAIHEGQWSESRHYIDSARGQLDAELTAVVGESYQRAYGAIVNAQLLTELEEVVTYKLVEERRNTIRKSWWFRLQGGQRLVEDWRKMLQIRGLVLSPREDFQTWLKFASLCRKTGAFNQAHKIVLTILGCDPVNNPDILLRIQEPRVVLAYSKNLWDAGNRRCAYDVLQRFVDNSEPDNEEQYRLLARCHLKLGSWCEALQEINELSIPEILRNYVAATNLAPDWYKACHAWACMNFETVLFHKQQDDVSESSIAGGSGDKKVLRTDFINTYTIPAIEGFFKSISLSTGSALQDTLRLLTLWFDYGHNTAIYDALFEGIRQIDIKIWLQVIPQLIARIDSPRSLVAKLVHILLVDISKLHPQALVYPLTVATKSSFVTRKNAATHILKTMSTHSQNLVNEAAVISEELIKVAILWHDQVIIAIDEASRYYATEKDYRGMFRTLDRMHAMLDRPPETLKEISFLQMYGRDLKEAQRWCELYKATGEDRYLNEAWELYYQVLRRIIAQFRSLTSLELQYVSRRLHTCRDFELAVPGSYVPQEPLVRISHIHGHLQVIKSKQRPRRLTIHGSDGKQYMFLLKGHEDLRQDERVMQLFGLVNTLLKADPNTYRHDLAIQRYAVIPLSPNSGLIGWVPQCDTLYNLISDYRDKKANKVPLNTEQQIMLRMASDYHILMLKHKVEVFEYTLSQTPGNDLARLLWLKSPSAEAWFERRTNYTRSLAVMSMVGYILGLGDRHPSNIMLHRVTGKVLHIDFGDCFEVTQTREKFPEKIPFRLTRMLINAMEVTGIEGTYRFTCEAVMHVLHRHKDSVMAVLEAFVHDPLLNWRLVEAEARSPSASSFSSGGSSYSPRVPSRSRARAHAMTDADVDADHDAATDAQLRRRARAVLTRVRDKLTGRDFSHVEAVVSVPRQLDLLVRQATSNENLCQCYIGWCPFW